MLLTQFFDVFGYGSIIWDDFTVFNETDSIAKGV